MVSKGTKCSKPGKSGSKSLTRFNMAQNGIKLCKKKIRPVQMLSSFIEFEMLNIFYLLLKISSKSSKFIYFSKQKFK